MDDKIKKTLYALFFIMGFLIGVLFSPAPTRADDTKLLSFKYNEHVVINITNQACPWKEVGKKYPNAAFAVRDDQQVLPGCFTHEGDNIVIQWYKGDTSVFPADYFLGPKDSI